VVAEGVAGRVSWVQRVRPYVADWATASQHVITEDAPYQLPRVGSSMLRDYGDSGPDSSPDSPWMSSASSSSAGQGMTGSGGGTATASS
jgi:hypothetical protein